MKVFAFFIIFKETYLQMYSPIAKVFTIFQSGGFKKGLTYEKVCKTALLNFS